MSSSNCIPIPRLKGLKENYFMGQHSRENLRIVPSLCASKILVTQKGFKKVCLAIVKLLQTIEGMPRPTGLSGVRCWGPRMLVRHISLSVFRDLVCLL